MLTALLIVASDAHASGTGHAPSIGDLTFYWINFVLYIALMSYLLRKPIKTAWASRTARIKQTVSDCTDQVASAERELNAIEALTKGLPTEQERARQQIISQANLEATDIVKQAEQRAARIREQSKEMLKGEMRSAQSSFRASLVSRALQLAKDRFSKGEYATREQAYVGAAVSRAKQLIQ
jgi:F0F1-type ATP synthase membrane subunit b/b'